MSYTIYLFGDLELPSEVQLGDVWNMGTGAALTSYVQLPGGGFYDNYGSLRSPQGIRPISKTCLLSGTEASIKSQLDALRGKLGETDRLTVRMGDDSLRWQWARLTDVDPWRSTAIPQTIQPVRLRWSSAAQYWYGLVADGDGWTWGDETWKWGDGSAQFSMPDRMYNLTTDAETIAVGHNGNIEARNLRIIIDYTAASGSNTDLTLVNLNTAQKITWTGSLTTDQSLIIDTGIQSIEQRYAKTGISNIQGDGGDVDVTTSGNHGLTSGQNVIIEGTQAYDGNYDNIDVTTSATFTATRSPDQNSAIAETVGTVRRRADAFANAVFSDKKNWLWLKPDINNNLNFDWTTFTNAYDVTLRYYDHYA